MVVALAIRGLIMVCGFIYPAYKCYKTVEKPRPDPEQLRFWCLYWIIMAMVTSVERFSDVFMSWLPMYNELKLAFIIYLWYPKTKGASFVYASFVRPKLQQHEESIDKHLNDVQTRACDMAAEYWGKGCGYMKERCVEFLAYAAAQSSRVQNGEFLYARGRGVAAREVCRPRPNLQQPRGEEFIEAEAVAAAAARVTPKVEHEDIPVVEQHEGANRPISSVEAAAPNIATRSRVRAAAQRLS